MFCKSSRLPARMISDSLKAGKQRQSETTKGDNARFEANACKYLRKLSFSALPPAWFHIECDENQKKKLSPYVYMDCHKNLPESDRDTICTLSECVTIRCCMQKICGVGRAGFPTTCAESNTNDHVGCRMLGAFWSTGSCLCGETHTDLRTIQTKTFVKPFG